VVVAGLGITAPELNHDDYAGLDVRGKIVLLVGGAPKSFPNLQRAHYASGRLKARNAVARGAVGVIAVDLPETEKLFGWARTVGHSRRPSFRWVERDGTAHNTFPQLAIATLSGEGAAAILGEARLARLFDDARAGKRSQLRLQGELTISSSFDSDTVASPNVIGVLPGSDPQLKNEYLVYTAHLDHLGVGAPIDGDAIYNGAFDNASGIAGLLEIARAFAALPERPKRSILFLAVTAEEKGLLGSDYFANQPTVPLEGIVANLNIDGLNVIYPPADMVVLGVDSSTLGEHARAAAQSLGLELSPDPRPQENFFVRSDQYSFVQAGVPALFSMPGQKSTDASVDAKKVIDDWLATHYHMPNDDMAQPLNFEAGARLAQFHFLTGLSIANATERPRWKKGDFFGETFGQKRR
jgi:Zn-dependent M28 family amino/carboxypeptidase